MNKKDKKELAQIKRDITSIFTKRDSNICLIKNSSSLGTSSIEKQWDSALRSYSKAVDIDSTRYCRVSMQDISSLAEFKTALFESNIPMSNFGQKVDFEAFKKDIFVAETWVRKVITRIPLIAGITTNLLGDLSGAIVTKGIDKGVKALESLIPRFNGNKAIILVSGIEAIDVMRKTEKLKIINYINQLGSSENCKIGIIEDNSTSFDSDYVSAMRRLRMCKVIDVDFSSSLLASDIFKKLEGMKDLDQLKNKIRHIDVKNHFVLEKIKSQYIALEPLLEGVSNPEIKDSIFTAMCIAAQSVHAGKQTHKYPDIEFISDKREHHVYHKDLEKPWSAMLKDFKYNHKDSLTNMVVSHAVNGRIDSREFTRTLIARDNLLTGVKKSRRTKAILNLSAEDQQNMVSKRFSDNDAKTIPELERRIRDLSLRGESKAMKDQLSTFFDQSDISKKEFEFLKVFLSLGPEESLMMDKQYKASFNSNKARRDLEKAEKSLNSAGISIIDIAALSLKTDNDFKEMLSGDEKGIFLSTYKEIKNKDQKTDQENFIYRKMSKAVSSTLAKKQDSKNIDPSPV